ncbi:MAG: hypothetical protein HKN56_04640, partial [Gammaproteobacteria bacterium]|nr:hypothetical protein [Gammaproteobacteria bacterium]
MRRANSIHNSIRYLARTEWAGELRARALAEIGAHDLDATLAAFRKHSEFFRDRLAGVTSWADIPPLGKRELAGMPVVHFETGADAEI